MLWLELALLKLSSLKDNIKNWVRLFKPPYLEKDFNMERKVESKNMVVDTRHTTSNTYRENVVPSSNQPQRLTPQQLEETRAKGICFNCDNKYSKGHNCG